MAALLPPWPSESVCSRIEFEAPEGWILDAKPNREGLVPPTAGPFAMASKFKVETASSSDTKYAREIGITLHITCKGGQGGVVDEDGLIQLNPKVDKSPFCKEERRRILELYEIYGNRWSIIQSCFPSRSKLISHHFVKKSVEGFWNFMKYMETGGPSF